MARDEHSVVNFLFFNSFTLLLIDEQQKEMRPIQKAFNFVLNLFSHPGNCIIKTRPFFREHFVKS